MTGDLRVALTGDFLTPAGEVGWGDIGLSLLDVPGLRHEFLDVGGGEVPEGALAGFDALVALTPRITGRSLRGADRLRLIARFGVGFDSVDLGAATANGTIVTITRDAVARPVAQAALALLLAVSHRILDKDRLVRTHRWQDRLDHMGTGLTGRTIAFVGWGAIGQRISTLLASWDVHQVAHDPFVDTQVADRAGVRLGELDEVLVEADFVVVTAALTETTRGLVDGRAIALMKPSAFLVNVSRGPVVDQDALAAALHAHRLAGAALDVFRDEPPAVGEPILDAPNTVFAPHATAWTDELAWANGSEAFRSVLALHEGRRPLHIVNPEALDHPAWAESSPPG